MTILGMFLSCPYKPKREYELPYLLRTFWIDMAIMALLLTALALLLPEGG